MGCHFSFVHCLFRRGEKKTSLKSRREQSLKVTSGKTGRPVAEALPARPLPGRSRRRPVGSSGCAPTARGSRRSHPEKGGSVMMEQPGPAAPSRSLPTPPPPPRLGSPPSPFPRAALAPRRRGRPARQPTGCPRPAPRRAPSPVPTKQQRPPPPSFLSPADRLASSHFDHSRSGAADLCGGRAHPSTSGAT